MKKFIGLELEKKKEEGVSGGGVKDLHAGFCDIS
jgi:hypothetical protein